jgi:medium-chain acyl-[acyl-carrier-protein] hydrolase
MVQTNAWIANATRAATGAIQLFCFPYAGGSSSVFRSWRDELLPGVEVVPVHLPGREARLLEQPFTKLMPLLDELTEVLRRHVSGPFAFFGHSMGALVSFELARRMSQQYQLEPLHAFVAGYRAPQLPSHGKPIAHLPNQAFIEELRRMNGTPEAVLQNDEMMQLLLPALRADFTLCETYVYHPANRLRCPISALGGWQDSKASKDELEAWQEQTEGKFTLRMFPGDHFFVHTAQHAVLAAIAQDLHAVVESGNKQR